MKFSVKDFFGKYEEFHGYFSADLFTCPKEEIFKEKLLFLCSVGLHFRKVDLTMQDTIYTTSLVVQEMTPSYRVQSVIYRYSAWRLF